MTVSAPTCHSLGGPGSCQVTHKSGESGVLSHFCHKEVGLFNYRANQNAYSRKHKSCQSMMRECLTFL